MADKCLLCVTFVAWRKEMFPNEFLPTYEQRFQDNHVFLMRPELEHEGLATRSFRVSLYSGIGRPLEHLRARVQRESVFGS